MVWVEVTRGSRSHSCIDWGQITLLGSHEQSNSSKAWHCFNSQPKISRYQTFYQEEMNTPPCPYLKALHTLPDGLKIRNQDRFFFGIKAPRILQTWMVFLDPGRAWDVQALTVAVKLRPNLLLHSQALRSTHKHSQALTSTHKHSQETIDFVGKKRSSYILTS